MSGVDQACREVVESVEGALACGVVDLDTGMLMGIFADLDRQQEGHAELNDVVATASLELFLDADLADLERVVCGDGGSTQRIQEAHVASTNNYHFAKALKGGKAVMLLVTKKTTNIGMGWAQVRSAIGNVESHVP